MRLAKNGYGTISEINNLSADKFLNLIHYENFLSDYTSAIKALNKG